MRGEERRQRAMLVVSDPEQRVLKEHPLRRIKQLGRGSAQAALAGVRSDVQHGGTAVDPARAVAEGLAADGVVQGAQRAGCSASRRTTTFCSPGFWTWRWTRRASTCVWRIADLSRKSAIRHTQVARIIPELRTRSMRDLKSRKLRPKARRERLPLRVRATLARLGRSKRSELQV